MSDFEYSDWPDECEECAHEGGGCSHDMRPPIHGPQPYTPPSPMELMLKSAYEKSLASLFPDGLTLPRDIAPQRQNGKRTFLTFVGRYR